MLQVIVVMLAVRRVASKMNYEIDNYHVLSRKFKCNIIAWHLVHFATLNPMVLSLADRVSSAK